MMPGGTDNVRYLVDELHRDRECLERKFFPQQTLFNAPIRQTGNAAVIITPRHPRHNAFLSDRPAYDERIADSCNDDTRTFATPVQLHTL
jgi:hypothetical protein